MSAGTTPRERDKELSLVQHLGELRSRLVVSAIALVVGTGIAFYFGTQLIRILLLPVDCTFIPTFQCNEPPTTLVSFSPTENFTTYFRVALFAGFALAMPVILYEIYAYIDPALLPKERRFVRFMGLPVIGLFIVGMLFCYFILLPNAIKFLVTFGDEVIKNQLRACSPVGRPVIRPSLERVREVRLVRGDVTFEVVRVLVALTVSLLRHESGGRVAKMKGHWVHPRLGEVVLKLTEAALQRVRF